MGANYHNARAAIALEARDVPVETTFTTLCPVCNGGQSGEHKLRATRTHNGVLFVCLRASCGWRGFVAIDAEGVSKDTPPQRKSQPARPYDGQLRFDEQLNRLFLRAYKGFNWDGEYVGSRGLYWGDPGLVVYHCLDFSGLARGHVTRDAKKVIRTFRSVPDVTMFSVYRGSARRPWVLVEDCISAMCCASWGYNAVALLGTNVPDEVIEYLRGEEVIIYLDSDAQTRALNYANQHGWRALLLEADPKDCPGLGYVLEQMS